VRARRFFEWWCGVFADVNWRIQSDDTIAILLFPSLDITYDILFVAKWHQLFAHEQILFAYYLSDAGE